MATLVYWAIPVFLGALSIPAIAQELVQADRSQLRVIVNRDDVEVTACGVFANVEATNGAMLEIHEFFVGYDANLTARIEARKRSRTKVDFLTNKEPIIVEPGPQSFLLAAGDVKVIDPKRTYASTDPGYTIEEFDGQWMYHILGSIFTGEQVRFVSSYRGDKNPTVIKFFPEIPESEARKYLACINKLTSQNKLRYRTARGQ